MRTEEERLQLSIEDRAAAKIVSRTLEGKTLKLISMIFISFFRELELSGELF